MLNEAYNSRRLPPTPISTPTQTHLQRATRTCPDSPGNRQHMPSTGGPPGEIIIKRLQQRKLQRKCYRYTWQKHVQRSGEGVASGRWQVAGILVAGANSSTASRLV